MEGIEKERKRENRALDYTRHDVNEKRFNLGIRIHFDA